MKKALGAFIALIGLVLGMSVVAVTAGGAVLPGCEYPDPSTCQTVTPHDDGSTAVEDRDGPSLPDTGAEVLAIVVLGVGVIIVGAALALLFPAKRKDE